MRKINCDFCGKDISADYDSEYNCTLGYGDTDYDLCDECMEKFDDVRGKSGEKYSELKYEYDELIAKKMKSFFKKEIEKLKR